MRIVIATAKVPFVTGGADTLALGLERALVSAGHEAEIVAIPFKWYPPERILDQVLACRLLDVTESCGTKVDRLIGLKFPAYVIPHPRKVMWLVHQHRQAYDLWDHPEAGDLQLGASGTQVKYAIHAVDRRFIPEATAVFTIAKTVSARLEKYCAISSKPLYHPPAHETLFRSTEPEPYLFFPSRLTELKRQKLVLHALSLTKRDVKIRFAGSPDMPPYLIELQKLSRKLEISARVSWLGGISEEEKIRQYAACQAVVFPPLDEDYGYVTLEAMLSSKPVLTCVDSGGPNEFVIPGETGIVTDARPEALAASMDRIWEDRDLSIRMGQAARDRYASMKISWKHVVDALLA